MSVTREKLQEIFKVYEDKKNNNGSTIRTSQIAKLIRSARLFPSEQDIIELEKRVDPNKQGFFTMSRFVEAGVQFAGKQAHVNHQEELLRAFSFFDEEQSGYISEVDLKKIMHAFGEPLTEEESREILKYARITNGKIYYRDFVKTIISGKIE